MMDRYTWKCVYVDHDAENGNVEDILNFYAEEWEVFSVQYVYREDGPFTRIILRQRFRGDDPQQFCQTSCQMVSQR